MTEDVKDFLKKTLPTYSIYVDGKTVLKTDDLSEILNRLTEFVNPTTIKGRSSIIISNGYNFFDHLDDDD